MTTVLDPPRTVPADDLTRREVVIGAIGIALAAAGCGGDGAADADDPGRTRTIRHKLGTTDVPARAERVVALDANELEECVALGLTPVGSIPDPLPHLPPSAADIPPALTSAYEVRVERIAALRPDLIVGPDFYVEELYDRLSAIAPTVVTPRDTFADWKENLRFMGRTLGREEEARAVLADYDARARTARAAIDAPSVGPVTAMLAFEDRMYVYVRSFCNTVLADAGLRPPGAQVRALPEGEERLDLSLERIPILEARHIFLGRLADFPSPISDNPLFRRLPAVRSGRVHEVEGQTWNQGSVIAANAILDDVEEALA